jgi:MFS family permease
LSPKVLMFAVTYYGLTNLNGAVSVFLPQILKPFGLDNTTTTFVAAIPYLFGLAGMLVLGRLADRPGRRPLALYTALAISLVGLVASASFDQPAAKLISLCVAAFGVFAVLPTFWGLSTGFFAGAAAAGAIALINALGNLSSVVNPAVIGLINQRTGSFNGGLLWLAAMAAAAIVALTVVLLVWRPARRQSDATAQQTHA